MPSWSRITAIWALCLAACTPSALQPHPDASADAPPADVLTPLQTPAPPGRWYLDAGGQRWVLTVAQTQATMALEGAAEVTATVDWQASSGQLGVTWPQGAGTAHLDATVSDGVLAGRVCWGGQAAQPCAQHVTGWNDTVLDAQSPARAFELTIDGSLRARLRLHRKPNGSSLGTFKVYASVQDGADAEDLQREVTVLTWQGGQLQFAVEMEGGTWTFSGVQQGRRLSGTVQRPAQADATFEGQRAEVLGFGLQGRSPAERELWQQATRLRLQRLMMAGNPPPLAVQVSVLHADLPPQPSINLSTHRDDDAASQPQAYRLSELAFASTLANPRGGAPLTRAAHAWLALPTTPAPAGGFAAVLALNGHFGSAANTMDPASDDYWYGDALARRGFVVLALDVGHRPLAERSSVYSDYLSGDDASLGNGLHPAIRAADADSDWEEEGERVWDAERALDYLASLPQVNAKRLAVTGLSMGGELTTWVGALDPRVQASIVAGYSPDLGVVEQKPDNHPCWRWQHGDLREYVDVSDLQALVAPRTLLVETGLYDGSFSKRQPAFAADKQVLARARLAFGAQQGQLIHYLHDGEHAWRTALVPPGIRTPLLAAPSDAGDLSWQEDGQTLLRSQTLIDVLAAM